MTSTLTHFRLAGLLMPAAILVAAPQAPQAPEPRDARAEEESYQGEAPERYAMVRALEGEVRIRKGDLDEVLTRGTPIAEGDVVESRGRGVLQLGDGTRVAFAGATRFTVATLFTDKKGEKQVLLRLDHGRLRVLLGGQTDVRFRVDTPSGSAACFDKGGFTIEAERDKVVRLKVYSGRVTFTNERDEARIAAGERITVFSPQDGIGRAGHFNTYKGDDFDRWSDRAVIVQRGESWDRVPSEIRYYADELDRNGRWVSSDEFGWVWQPNGVAEDWRPYYQGRWAPYSGGMTWVSDEPWAYVAYHHGRWHWSLGIGWCWIPGRHYSPAWVAWHQTPGYYGWAPLGYYNTPCHWGYGAWGGGYAWNVVSVNHINVYNMRGHIRSDANVLRTFGGGNGGTTWRGGSRDLGAPWQRSPLMVSHTEFRNPGQIQTAFQRDVHRDRMNVYERHAQTTTGRVVHRELSAGRPISGAVGTAPGAAPNAGRVPFEDRGRGGRPEAVPRGPETRPLEPRRLEAPQATPRTEERSRSTSERRTEDRRPEAPQPTPRVEERPRPERRPDTPPVRERSEERPRPVEAQRPDPAPRERAPEFNFRAPREERRPEPTRTVERESRPESRPAPRPESRPEPRHESRPEPRHEPRPEPARESRPAPSPAPSPAPRPEPARESRPAPSRDLRR